MTEPANKLNRFQSALTGIFETGRFGAGESPGVVLSERRLALIDLAAGPETDAALDAAKKHFGLNLPTQSGGVAVANGVRALWTGPNHWLIKAPLETGLAQRWSDALPDVAINDVTHGRIVLQLHGPSAREILASGCPLDLRSHAFPTGACASSLLENIHIVIDCLKDDEFEIVAGRAYARSLWDWITTAASAYGYQTIDDKS